MNVNVDADAENGMPTVADNVDPPVHDYDYYYYYYYHHSVVVVLDVSSVVLVPLFVVA